MHKSKEISVLQQYKQRFRNQDTSRTTSLQEKNKNPGQFPETEIKITCKETLNLTSN